MASHHNGIESHRGPDASATASIRILIAAPGDADRAFLRGLISDGPYSASRLVEAVAGDAAIDICSAAPPAVVIATFDLGGMNAAEMTGCLSRPTAGAGLPMAVVVVTDGSEHSDQTGAALVAGAQECVSRSWLTPPILAHAIDNALARFALERQLRERSASLVRNEERYRRLIESTTHCVWGWNPTTNWQDPVGLDWWEHLTGHAANQSGWTWLDIVHPADREEARQRWADGIRTRDPQALEYRVRRKDGAWRWIRAHAAPVLDASGGVREWTGTVSDITESKLDDQRAALEHATLRVLSEAGSFAEAAQRLADAFAQHSGAAGAAVRWIDDGVPSCAAAVAAWHDRRVLRFIEPAAKDGAGLSAWLPRDANDPVWVDTLHGTTPFVMRHAALAAGVRSVLAIPFVREARCVRLAELFFDTPPSSDGMLIEAARAVTAQVIEFERRIAAVVRERKAASALYESEQRYRLAIKATNDVVWECDLRTGTVQRTEALQHQYGWTDGMVDSDERWWRERVHPEDLARIEATREGMSLDDLSSVWREEYRFSKADGTFADVVDRCYGLRNQAGELVLLVGAMQDITIEKQVQSERERRMAVEQVARAEAERANLLKDGFLAELSHELRTPLSAILGWLRIARDQRQTVGSREQILDTVQRNAELLSDIVDELLDVSRISAGKLVIEQSPLDVGQTIEASVGSTLPYAASKGVRVDTDLTAGVQTVGDSRRLQQVWWNLLNNAIRYTPSGGSVTIALTCDDGLATVTVTDTGDGIEPALLPLIFDRFKRPADAPPRRDGGLGLGLTIVRHLVHEHRGQVSVESAGRGLGTRFTVRLPITVR